MANYEKAVLTQFVSNDDDIIAFFSKFKGFLVDTRLPIKEMKFNSTISSYIMMGSFFVGTTGGSCVICYKYGTAYYIRGIPMQYATEVTSSPNVAYDVSFCSSKINETIEVCMYRIISTNIGGFLILNSDNSINGMLCTTTEDSTIVSTGKIMRNVKPSGVKYDALGKFTISIPVGSSIYYPLSRYVYPEFSGTQAYNSILIGGVEYIHMGGSVFSPV